MPRNLGDLGEAHLSQWCAEVGITCNKASQDRTGWDYLLEFPQALSSEHIPADLQPPAVQCLVQVKATDAYELVRDVKLSNWMRLVRSPLPAFFLFVGFDRKNTCRTARLVHVWEDEIRAVLHRVRQLDSEGKVDLHKRTMRLKAVDTSPLAPPSGEALRDAIQEAVGGDQRAYTEEKLQLLKSVGREETSGEIVANVVVPEGYRDRPFDELLVDFALGVVPELEMAKSKMWDVRFGIRSRKPQEFDTRGAIRVDRKPVQTGSLKIRTVDGNHEVIIEAEAFAPGGVSGAVSDDKLKLLIEAPSIRLFLNPKAQTADLELLLRDPTVEHPLPELVPLAQFLAFMNDAGVADGPVDFRVWFANKSLGRAILEFDEPVPEAWYEWSGLVNRAVRLSEHLGLSLDARVKVEELWRARSNLKFLDDVIRSATGPIRGNFRSESKPSGHTALMGFPDIVIGPTRIVASVAVVGTPESAKDEVDEYVIHADAPKLGPVLTQHRHEDLTQADLDELIENLQTELPPGTNLIRWWDENRE